MFRTRSRVSIDQTRATEDMSSVARGMGRKRRRRGGEEEKGHEEEHEEAAGGAAHSHGDEGQPRERRRCWSRRDTVFACFE